MISYKIIFFSAKQNPVIHCAIIMLHDLYIGWSITKISKMICTCCHGDNIGGWDGWCMWNVWGDMKERDCFED